MARSRREFLTCSVAAAALGSIGSAAGVAGTAESPAGEVIFQRRIAVRHEVDVFVAGSEPAGVTAAVAAAGRAPASFSPNRATASAAWGPPACCPLHAFHRRRSQPGRRHRRRNPAAAAIQRRQRARQQRDDPGRSPQGCTTTCSGANVDFSFHTSLIAVQSDAERVSAAVLAGRADCLPSRPGPSLTARATATWPRGLEPLSKRATSTAT